MEKQTSRKTLSGKVQTVLGLIDTDALGLTLTHEHLFTQMSHIAKEPAEPVARDLFHAPLDINLLGAIRHGRAVNLEDCRLDDETSAIEEVAIFKKAGGGTLVDASSIGVGRDPRALARVSSATGLNIVMGCSYYVEANYPPESGVEAKDEDTIVDEIVGDIFTGADGTEIAAGIIGEVGCSWPLTATESKVLRASGRAQRITGAALSIHPGRHSKAPGEIVEVLREAKADLNRTIICHMDRTLDNHDMILELAASGCVLEYDLFGSENSYYPWALPVDMPNDARRLGLLQLLVAEGFGDQIVISHDICFKHQLVRHGGHGYAHIPANVVPLMRRKGFDEETIHAILVDTPARLLTFAADEADLSGTQGQSEPAAVSIKGTAAVERLDLRSDFISRPTEAMMEAMVAAGSETPAIEFRDDTIVTRLEKLSAELLGKEDALFCPTCTLCNQIAVNAFCRPADILLVPANAHVLTSEGGAAAALSGAQVEVVETKRGAMLPDALEVALGHQPGGGRPRIGLIMMENTHLRAGGRAIPEDKMKAVAEVAAAHGIPVHLDGSRLFNAAAFLGVEAKDLARHADTVSLSLNKGLSAPLGAVLAGTAELIAEALEIRQRFGGGWRPAGIPAAAGIVALEQMTGCMAEDNKNAQSLARGLAEIEGVSVINGPVETNILLIAVDRPGFDRKGFLDRLAGKGVLLMSYDEGTIRAVLHKDITAAHINGIVRKFEEAL